MHQPMKLVKILLATGHDLLCGGQNATGHEGSVGTVRESPHIPLINERFL